MKRGYGLFDIDLAAGPGAVAALKPTAGQNGIAVIIRDGQSSGQIVDFRMFPSAEVPTSGLSVTDLVRHETRQAMAAARLRAKLTLEPHTAPPALTVAICTKDRTDWLRRLLNSLLPQQEEYGFELLVVDNASVSPVVREIAEEAGSVRYVREGKAGLDFARNRALAEATGDIVAFLDDDTVVDVHWTRHLLRAWAENPDAGCVTGQVLPMKLDHEAQVLFELGGGFRRGFVAARHKAARPFDPLFPTGAGQFGAGANMSVDRTFILALGGFDEALDTGRPLPGGGDLDIFYRVLTGGRSLVYEPAIAVFHEHRADRAVLRHQYYTWGLGFFAFLEKCHRTDPERRAAHRLMVAWWVNYQLHRVAKRLLGRYPTPMDMILAEIWGGMKGVAGEYNRSLARVSSIRRLAE